MADWQECRYPVARVTSSKRWDHRFVVRLPLKGNSRGRAHGNARDGCTRVSQGRPPTRESTANIERSTSSPTVLRGSRTNGSGVMAVHRIDRVEERAFQGMNEFRAGNRTRKRSEQRQQITIRLVAGIAGRRSTGDQGVPRKIQLTWVVIHAHHRRVEERSASSN